MIWRLLGGAAAVALLGLLVWFYGNSREHAGKLEERLAWNAERALYDAKVANFNQEMADDKTKAVEDYATKLASIEPVVIENTRTIERFAATPAGRVLCLTAERVRGIENTAAQLGLQDTFAARGLDGAMLPDSD